MKLFHTLLALFSIGAVPAPAQDTSQLCRVTLVPDAGRAEALAELGAWRARGEHDVVRSRLETLRASASARTSVVRAHAEALGAEVLAELWLVPGLAVRGDAARELEDHPLVARVEPAGLRGPNLAQATAAHNLPAVHAMTFGGSPLEGEGVTIAVLDTGMDLDTAGLGRPHASLYADGNPAANGPGIGGSRVLSSASVAVGFGPDCAVDSGEDKNGHGTRMASIAAGADWNTVADIADGAAPGAWLRNYRIADCVTGLASTVAMEIGIEAALEAPDVRVVNLSYDGDSNPFYPLNVTIDAAAQAGLTVVLSAGNSGVAKDFQHGAYNAIPVGSSFQAQAEPYAFPGFQTSAIGPLPDGRRYPALLAVGEQVTCAELDDEAGSVDSFGTSAAAALTSGTAALVYQAAPGLDPRSVKALLLNTTADVVAGDLDAAGFGFLDAQAAVNDALAGNVRSAVALDGFETRFSMSAQQGEDLRLTLVWERELGQSPFAIGVDDLDLFLRAPDGTIVASSQSALDNVETIRTTAQENGVYTAAVRLRAQNASPFGEFALAGVSATAVYAPFACPGGAPSIEQLTPQSVEIAFGEGSFVIKGCQLASTLAVTVAGQPASFQVESDQQLVVDVPPSVPLGNQNVVVTNAVGPASASVAIGAAGPQLATYPNFGGFVGWDLTAEPNELYWVVVSALLAPSSFPGIVDLAIGSGGTNLIVVDNGITDAFGQAAGILGNPGLQSLPAATILYFQAVTFSATTMSLTAGNVSQSIKAF